MKSKSQTISYALNLSLCSDFFLQRGYYLHELNNSEIWLFKPGTSFTVSLKRIPLTLSIRLGDAQTEVSLSYGTWVLFDTGDLKKELSRIISQIEMHKQDLA